MITFENGALTIDTTLSVADSQAIHAFADTVRNGEKERIIKLLEAQCERPLDPKWEHYRESCSCWQIALIKGEK